MLPWSRVLGKVLGIDHHADVPRFRHGGDVSCDEGASIAESELGRRVKRVHVDRGLACKGSLFSKQQEQFSHLSTSPASNAFGTYPARRRLPIHLLDNFHMVSLWFGDGGDGEHKWHLGWSSKMIGGFGF